MIALSRLTGLCVNCLPLFVCLLGCQLAAAADQIAGGDGLDKDPQLDFHQTLNVCFHR